METRRLRYFLAVVRTGTVTAAAEQLQVAQPALSRQLRRLEAELGLTLFERNGPRLRLTNAGRELVRVAQDLVARADQIESFAQHMAHGTLRRMTVVAAETTINEVIAPFVTTLAPTDPFIAVRELPANEVGTAIADGADLGVVVGVPTERSLTSRSLTDVPLRAYVAPGHPWALRRRRACTLDELVAERLVLLTREHPARGVLDRAVARAGLAYADVEESSTEHMSEALARAGFGVSVVTALPRFGAYPLMIEAPDRTTLRLHLYACWPVHHYASAAVASLVDRLSRFSATHVHSSAWFAGPAHEGADDR